MTSIESPRTPPGMLPIGQFSRFVGLSIRMLRHYDEHGVLSPARVDPGTGYQLLHGGPDVGGSLARMLAPVSSQPRTVDVVLIVAVPSKLAVPFVPARTCLPFIVPTSFVVAEQSAQDGGIGSAGPPPRACPMPVWTPHRNSG